MVQTVQNQTSQNRSLFSQFSAFAEVATGSMQDIDEDYCEQDGGSGVGGSGSGGGAGGGATAGGHGVTR